MKVSVYNLFQANVQPYLMLSELQQGLFILSTQAALFRRDKQKSVALIVFPHIGVEVRHGAPFPGYVARAPLDEEADRKTPKHAQDPYGIRSSYPAGIIASAGVQPLM